MREYGIVFFIAVHPGIREENVGLIVTLKRRAERVVIVVKFNVAELYVRVKLIESVKLRFKRLKVIVVSGYGDAAAYLGIEGGCELFGGFNLRFAALTLPLSRALLLNRMIRDNFLSSRR